MNSIPSSILVERSSQWVNRMRDINIYIDGKYAGSVSNGKTAEFPVSSGTHNIYAKVDWCATRSQEITIPPGQSLYLELGSPLTGGKIFLAMIYAFFKTKDYLYLRVK
jgi:hypothetical protein